MEPTEPTEIHHHDDPTADVAKDPLRAEFAVNSTVLDRASKLFEAPKQIGPYHILELLGAGGMGEVYKAERRSPMRQTVAIKIVKLGFDTREVVARFESERQALARMDHPHIAKVLDAGTTEHGRPYFVMEHVSGQPITAFADEHKLTIRERLQLFEQLCGAIAHAHSKAIIHRDIKSNNVLAYMHDDKPTIKVIDFGIAKALTNDRLTDATFNTERGRIVGTYDSMSPEQAQGSADIDTRTDVYSLGVLLYELLTGVMPFDHETLARAADDEIRRIIREVEPPRPSTRLTSLGGPATKIAQLRCQQLDALTKQLRSELEWIPLKAMRKERSRRYASAEEFARDIQNYLNQRPLIAGPESRVYRARKFLKRNRLLVSAAIIVAIGVAVGIAGLIRSQHMRVQVTARENELFRANAEARAGLEELAKSVNDKAVLHMDRGELPNAEATLRKAIEQARPKLGADDPIVLTVMNNLALVLKRQGRIADAEALNREVLDRRRRSLGNDDPETLFSINNLGGVLLEKREYDAAEPLLLEALQRSEELNGPDDPQTLTAVFNLATLRRLQGNFPQAEALHRRALDARRRVRQNDDLETLISINSLGALLRDQKRFSEAEPLLREALSIRRRQFGDQHPDTMMSIYDFAMLLRDQGKPREAEPLLKEVVELRGKMLGASHLETLGAQYKLAQTLEQVGKISEALEVYRQLYERVPQAEIAPTQGAVLVSGYGLCLVRIGRLRDAEQPLRDAYRRLDQAKRQEHIAMRDIATALAELCETTNRHDEAMHWRTELAKLRAATQPATAPR